MPNERVCRLCRRTRSTRRASWARRSYPGVGGNDQHAKAAFDAPERDGLLVPAELGRGLPRYVAGLKRSLLVPDRDRVGIVLVLRLGHQCQAAARVERGVVDVPRPEGHTRDRDDSKSRVLPADPLGGRRIAEVVAARAALEPETEPLSHPATLRAAAVPATPGGLSTRTGASGDGN